MENGTIWGHGAYLGPDFSAAYLHTLALDTEKTVAERRGVTMQAAFPPSQRLIVNAEVARLLKQNRYDPISKILTFSAAEAVSYHRQLGLWTISRILRTMVACRAITSATLPSFAN
jgi:nitric oxide reductase subunit B